jgi:hypothetical protein
MVASGVDLARKTSETYEQLIQEFAKIQAGVESDSLPIRIPVSDNYPIHGDLREKIGYIIANSNDSGLSSGDIVRILKDKAHQYHQDLALSKIPTTLLSMERKYNEVKVQRMPNGRKLYFTNYDNVFCKKP